MKAQFLATAVFTALACVESGAAQPPNERLADAVEALRRAGNYTWDEKRGHDSTPSKRGMFLRPWRSGHTEIDGFTVSAISRHPVVFWKEETAVKLARGWCHIHDLTDEDFTQLKFWGEANSRGANNARRYTRPLVHELLELCVRHGKEIRSEGTAIVGELGANDDERRRLEQLVISGQPPDERTMLGTLTQLQALRSGRPVRDLKQMTVRFTVDLASGNVDEFTIEFVRNISRAVSAEGPTSFVTLFRTRLTDIGRTRVEVEPEAKALFLAAGR